MSLPSFRPAFRDLRNILQILSQVLTFYSEIEHVLWQIYTLVITAEQGLRRVSLAFVVHTVILTYSTILGNSLTPGNITKSDLAKRN